MFYLNEDEIKEVAGGSERDRKFDWNDQSTWIPDDYAALGECY